MGGPEHLGAGPKLLLGFDQLLYEDLCSTGDAGVKVVAEVE